MWRSAPQRFSMSRSVHAGRLGYASAIQIRMIAESIATIAAATPGTSACISPSTWMIFSLRRPSCSFLLFLRRFSPSRLLRFRRFRQGLGRGHHPPLRPMAAEADTFRIPSGCIRLHRPFRRAEGWRAALYFGLAHRRIAVRNCATSHSAQRREES